LVRARTRRRRRGSSGGDLAGYDGRILAHADEKRRLALAEEVDAHEVEPVRHRAGALLVDRETEFVERLGKGTQDS
jgi:hypothetical protein